MMRLPTPREWVFPFVVTLCCIGMYFLPSPPPLAQNEGSSELARVISVDNADIRRHGLIRFGSQNLEVEVRSGRAKGRRFSAGNELRGNLELDKEFRPGDLITVTVPDDADPNRTVLTARDHWRTGWELVLFGAFCLLLVVFGGWVGVKALLSFVFSCFAVWKLVIPLVLRGWSADWVIFGTVAILTGAIVGLVAGFSRKGLAAFIGSAAGVLAGLGMAHIFGRLMKINGATMPYVQVLWYSGYENLSLSDTFIGAMMLAGSGAVMDLAMDIAAGVEEVARHNPGLPFRELAASGIRIGRSVVGTMTTTLLLAYSGGYITLLMVFAAQGTGIADILNNQLVAAEAVKTLIGSFSLVLVAPLTALAAGLIFAQKRPSVAGSEKTD